MVTLGNHFCLVFAQICLGEILSYQILGLYFVPITDDKFHRTVQCIQQPVEVGRNVGAGSTGPQHDDLNWPLHGKVHAATSNISFGSVWI